MSVQIVGRSSSHFTRVTLIVAHELGLPFEWVPVFDVTAVDPRTFGGNPALKIPMLRRGGSQVFGTENICRALLELAPSKRIVWPEELRADLSRNAQELVWHGMAAQVQLIMGTMVSKLPAQDPFFAKIRAGLEGALEWLDGNVGAALEVLPTPRDLSLFEVTLFCLVEHLGFRGTLPVAPYPALVRFAHEFGERASAKATAYKFDVRPS